MSGRWLEVGPVFWKLCYENVERRNSKDAQENRDAASAEFRKQGIAATGLAEIMRPRDDACGFYRHFKSKDELVAETTAAAAESSKESYSQRL